MAVTKADEKKPVALEGDLPLFQQKGQYAPLSTLDKKVDEMMIQWLAIYAELFARESEQAHHRWAKSDTRKKMTESIDATTGSWGFKLKSVMEIGAAIAFAAAGLGKAGKTASTLGKALQSMGGVPGAVHERHKNEAQLEHRFVQAERDDVAGRVREAQQRMQELLRQLDRFADDRKSLARGN